MITSKRLLYGTSLIIGTVIATTGLEAVRSTETLYPAVIPAANAATADPADSTANQLSHAFRRATSNAMPGVVYIEVEQRRETPQPDMDFGGFFRGMIPSGPQLVEGSGSGFIFRPDGYIMTNNHVVQGATHVTVVTQDRREYKATVVGRDPNTDIAVVKIDARGLPVVAFANSDVVDVGDWTVALGYPLQLGATATAGIISAKGRSLGILATAEDGSPQDAAVSPIEHYIQTDAAINPGNSGGPLVDLQGRVIGVNSAIKSPTGYYSGYGFAVPINIAARVATDLIEHGAVRRPKLGVALDDVSAADAVVYKLPRVAGAEIITAPERDSPAARAGIRIGDVVVALDGKALETEGDLRERLSLFQPGDAVTLDVIRYGEKKQFKVRLGEFEFEHPATAQPTSSDDDVSKLGFEVMPMSPQIARQISSTTSNGLVISAVAPGSPAYHADLRRGYLLKSVNGRAVSTVAEVQSFARTLKPGQAVSLMLATPDGQARILNFQVRI
jgi:serine protease Do